MARHRPLSRAPLREALIDLRFETRLPLVAIERFAASIDGRYGKKQSLWEAVFGLNNTGPSLEARTSNKSVGVRLEAAAAPFVLQCRESGFTLSRLLPYGRWEDLQTEARELWDLLQQQVGTFLVSRMAVRYINEIKIPLPLRDFADYLTCPPKVPDALPQAITGFLTRVIIPDEVSDSVSVITQALEGPPTEGPAGSFVTVLLDIDVFRHVQIESQGEAIWNGLGVLRDQKNKMFFEHVTEATAELYE